MKYSDGVGNFIEISWNYGNIWNIMKFHELSIVWVDCSFRHTYFFLYPTFSWCRHASRHVVVWVMSLRVKHHTGTSWNFIKFHEITWNYMKFHEILWYFPWQAYHSYYNYKIRFNNPNIPTITIDCDIKPHAITTQCVIFLEFYTLKFQSAGFLAFEISLKFHEIAETQKALKFQVTQRIS